MGAIHFCATSPSPSLLPSPSPLWFLFSFFFLFRIHKQLQYIRLHSPNYSDRVSYCVYLLHAGVFKTLLCTFGFSYNNGIQITRIVSKQNSYLYVVAMTSSRQQAIPLFSIVPPLSAHVLPSFTKFEENDRLLAV